jgi:hypothetical protein
MDGMLNDEYRIRNIEPQGGGIFFNVSENR